MPRPTRPTTSELLLACGLAVTGSAEVWVPFQSRQGSGSMVSATVGILLVSVLALWCRRRPLVMLLGVVLGWGAIALLAPTFILFYGQMVPLLVAVFMAARHGRGRLPWLTAGLAAATLLTIDLTVSALRDPNEIVFHWVVTGLAWSAGYGLARWQRKAHESTRRAVQAEVEATQRAMEAVVEERTRIARELHDIVAHSISSIVVQAGAAEQAGPQDHDFVMRALTSIRTTGNAALGEMQRLVTMVRDSDEAPLEPQPGLSALPSLIERARADGVATTLTVDGPARTLPAGLDLAIYRIVQESLTNVRRHSRASRCDVRIVYAAGEIRIEIVDDGTAAPPVTAGGHGVVGMRERAALYGGWLAIGPEPRGGFAVRAALPVEP